MQKSTQEIINRFKVRDGVTICVSSSNQHGEKVEIRESGYLVWRAFNWESNFYFELNKNLSYCGTDKVKEVLTEFMRELYENRCWKLAYRDAISKLESIDHKNELTQLCILNNSRATIANLREYLKD
ncbi:hypothetical protein [Yersinia ruckeri]|uniref:hypothetical protein n=1 Tax=Yersinia ruckeri TaxID=29486 RepID=UPI001F44FDB4|nr:hypothetical protein [Yersinia ruckeri]UIN19247.1 hypothetical protein LGL86_17645 [Yersinia ruckeri]